MFVDCCYVLQAMTCFQWRYMNLVMPQDWNIQMILQLLWLRSTSTWTRTASNCLMTIYREYRKYMVGFNSQYYDSLFFFTKLLTHNGILFLFAEQLFLVKHVNEKNRNYFIQVLQIKTHNPQDYSQLPRLPACTLSLTLENMTGRVALIAPHRSQNLPIPTPNPTSAMEVSTLWHSYGRSCLSSKYE